jgi:hypothetical protein
VSLLQKNLMNFIYLKSNANTVREIKFKNAIFILYLQQEVFIDLLFIFQEPNCQQKTRLLTGFYQLKMYS